MSTPFLKTVTLQPPPVPTGTDARNLRPFLEQLRQVVAQCVQAINSANVPYTPRVSQSGSAGEETPPEAPTVYTTIGSATEGADAAESTTWTYGDKDLSNHEKGCWFYAMTRVTYFDSGSRVLYGYVRKITISTGGKVFSIGPETQVVIDVPTLL